MKNKYYTQSYYNSGIFFCIFHENKQTNKTKQVVLKRVFFKKVQQHQLGTTYCEDK